MQKKNPNPLVIMSGLSHSTTACWFIFALPNGLPRVLNVQHLISSTTKPTSAAQIHFVTKTKPYH
jgi:hypothetical protein